MREVTGLCENCGERPATGIWIGAGGRLAMSREYMQKVWCKRCMLTEQIRYARKAAESLPELESKLNALEDDVQ